MKGYRKTNWTIAPLVALMDFSYTCNAGVRLQSDVQHTWTLSDNSGFKQEIYVALAKQLMNYRMIQNFEGENFGKPQEIRKNFLVQNYSFL